MAWWQLGDERFRFWPVTWWLAVIQVAGWLGALTGDEVVRLQPYDVVVTYWPSDEVAGSTLAFITSISYLFMVHQFILQL